MPFFVIQGTYHLVNRTASGTPTGFEPDGDSIHFRPANPALLDRLRVLARPYRLTAIGSVQLRLEGLDRWRFITARTAAAPRPASRHPWPSRRAIS
jgi:hypothetical protein